MKIVIDITEFEWAYLNKRVKNGEQLNYIERLIVNGTPLPKRHGDLIDVKDVLKKINLNYNNHQMIDVHSIKDIISTTQPIIEADKAESEELHER